MQSMELLELLRRPEGKTLEFRQELSKSPERLARTVCAFANTAGGDILFGIADKTQYVVGVPDPQKLEETIENIIADWIAPDIIPTIETLVYEQSSVLVVRIYPNSSSRPHYIKKETLENATYIRVGSSNRLADLQMIEELQRLGKRRSFEEEQLIALTTDAVDFDPIANCFKPIRQLKKTDLISLKLVTEFQDKLVPTNAGMILFGKERERYFPNAKIKAVRFFGLTKDLKTIDSRDIDSYPAIAAQEAMDFIKKHANYESEISNSQQGERWNVQRSERWNIPVAAVREAIINAILHADYSQKGACIRLFIYQNRIEIENPGLLVTGLTIEDITRGISKLRNPIIGRIFNELGLIEQYGSGINKIIQECEKFGLDTPTFEEIATHFRVTIYTTPKKTPLLDDLDNAIVDVLRYQYFSNPEEGLSTKEIMNKANISQRATRNHLLSLVESGFIVEIGRGTTDPKKKYFLREEYAKIPTFIPNNKIRQNLQGILDSNVDGFTRKIEEIEKILKIPAGPIIYSENYNSNLATFVKKDIKNELSYPNKGALVL
ncbi:MAG: ATP-binding protein [Alphaproteobacteria bacterium]